MKKNISLIVLVAALISMGLSMPGCPGQQALQKQVDELTAKSLESSKRIQNLETQVRSLTGDMNQVKTLLTQVSNTVLAQKTAIEQLEGALKAKGGKAKSSGKKRR
jgi:septal ring factor EnvC (AmiA/AmiB activator)